METDGHESVDELVENEWYIVRHSGETPEIAYNSAMYFLQRAKDGPTIKLSRGQLQLLQQAAVDRYEEIIVRDICHDNVGTSSYRGIARSICNYGRFVTFCLRQDLDPEQVKKKAAPVYSRFLEREYQNIFTRQRQSVINCSFNELRDFAIRLDVSFFSEYQRLQPHCLSSL